MKLSLLAPAAALGATLLATGAPAMAQQYHHGGSYTRGYTRASGYSYRGGRTAYRGSYYNGGGYYGGGYYNGPYRYWHGHRAYWYNNAWGYWTPAGIWISIPL